MLLCYYPFVTPFLVEFLPPFVLQVGGNILWQIGNNISSNTTPSSILLNPYWDEMMKWKRDLRSTYEAPKKGGMFRVFSSQNKHYFAVRRITHHSLHSTSSFKWPSSILIVLCNNCRGLLALDVVISISLMSNSIFQNMLSKKEVWKN